MNESEDKKLERLVDHMMKGTELESPSFDFTSKVMLQALATQTNKAIVYKPLIPKLVFIGVIGGFIALFFYLLNNAEPQISNRFLGVDFSSIFTVAGSSLFEISKITVYAVVVTTLVWFVQISFLKKHFENQLEK